jgi:ribose/xylose/arabinose/galactoside ABC-type transport system permease subunit
MQDFGVMIIKLGMMLIFVGIIFYFSNKISFPGNLPGDIKIEKEGFSFYFPLMSSILISIFLTILFRLFSR